MTPEALILADQQLLGSLLEDTKKRRWLPKWAHRFVCIWFGFDWAEATYKLGDADEMGWRVCCNCGHAERAP